MLIVCQQIMGFVTIGASSPKAPSTHELQKQQDVSAKQSLQENKVFFTRKIGQQSTQMAPLRPNQDVILDKSFWTQPFLLGVFC